MNWFRKIPKSADDVPNMKCDGFYIDHLPTLLYELVDPEGKMSFSSTEQKSLNKYCRIIAASDTSVLNYKNREIILNALNDIRHGVEPTQTGLKNLSQSLAVPTGLLKNFIGFLHGKSWSFKRFCKSIRVNEK